MSVYIYHISHVFLTKDRVADLLCALFVVVLSI